jgi:tRNA-dihydrouridine synthase
MKIGTIDLTPPFALAPMAGMTDTAFRRLVKR